MMDFGQRTLARQKKDSLMKRNRGEGGESALIKKANGERKAVLS